MIRIANAQLWVHDQDEALAFYTQKLGMELRADVTVPEMGNFRWLTVGPPGQDDFAITLMAKGFAGTVFLTTGDVHATYDELRGRGVEFGEAPTEYPYGIDSSFRDPSGNNFRLTQLNEAWADQSVAAKAAG